MSTDFGPAGPRHSEHVGWQLHQVLQAWTTSVDIKASIVLTVETASLGLVVAFTDAGKPLGHLAGAELWTYRGGMALGIVAVAFAAAVVFPQLDRRTTRSRWRDNYVYFGHLAHWAPGDLAQVLRDNDTERDLQVLSAELVIMSRIAWRKHCLLQLSIAAWFLAAAAIGLAAAAR